MSAFCAGQLVGLCEVRLDLRPVHRRRQRVLQVPDEVGAANLTEDRRFGEEVATEAVGAVRPGGSFPDREQPLAGGRPRLIGGSRPRKPSRPETILTAL